MSEQYKINPIANIQGVFSVFRQTNTSTTKVGEVRFIEGSHSNWFQHTNSIGDHIGPRRALAPSLYHSMGNIVAKLPWLVTTSQTLKDAEVALSGGPVVPLRAAENPAKAGLLALVEELRAGIEDGSILSLVAIPINPNREWATRSAGSMRMLELVGLLECAKADAVSATQS